MAQTATKQFADANRVRVLETNILHAHDVVHWLDGSSAEATADMDLVARDLNVEFTARPRDVVVVQKPGRLAAWRRPTDDMVEGVATDAQKQRAAVAGFNLAGEVSDPRGRFNPALFDLTLGSGAGATVLLYPTPLGTSLASVGGVIGTLRFEGSGDPAVWALLELEVTLSIAETQVYRAQADRNGDFVIALNRLPPLPESVTEYAAVLRVSAIDTASADVTPDTTTFVSQEIESSDTDDAFATDFALDVVPGEVVRVNSFENNFLAVQPA